MPGVADSSAAASPGTAPSINGVKPPKLALGAAQLSEPSSTLEQLPASQRSAQSDSWIIGNREQLPVPQRAGHFRGLASDEKHVSFSTAANVEVLQFNVDDGTPQTSRGPRRVFGGEVLLQQPQAPQGAGTVPHSGGGCGSAAASHNHGANTAALISGPMRCPRPRSIESLRGGTTQAAARQDVATPRVGAPPAPAHLRPSVRDLDDARPMWMITRIFRKSL